MFSARQRDSAAQGRGRAPTECLRSHAYTDRLPKSGWGWLARDDVGPITLSRAAYTLPSRNNALTFAPSVSSPNGLVSTAVAASSTHGSSTWGWA